MILERFVVHSAHPLQLYPNGEYMVRRIFRVAKDEWINFVDTFPTKEQAITFAEKLSVELGPFQVF